MYVLSYTTSIRYISSYTEIHYDLNIIISTGQHQSTLALVHVFKFFFQRGAYVQLLKAAADDVTTHSTESSKMSWLSIRLHCYFLCLTIQRIHSSLQNKSSFSL